MGVFLYSIIAYIVGLIGQVWLILYLGDWDFLTTIDAPQHHTARSAVLIDTMLVLLFALQHSVMARQWFKAKLANYVPPAAERSTYVLFSGIALLLIVFYWQPIEGYLWRADNSMLWWALTSMMLFGWLFSVVATFIINHFELFGLQQGYLHLKNKTMPNSHFREKLFYKFIRHPIQLGVLIGIWFTPVMSYGHLLLSLLFTIYIFVGLHYEERDLALELGDAYKEYKQRVGMLFPKIKQTKT